MVHFSSLESPSHPMWPLFIFASIQFSSLLENLAAFPIASHCILIYSDSTQCIVERPSVPKHSSKRIYSIIKLWQINIFWRARRWKICVPTPCTSPSSLFTFAEILLHFKKIAAFRIQSHSIPFHFESTDCKVDSDSMPQLQHFTLKSLLHLSFTLTFGRSW